MCAQPLAKPVVTSAPPAIAAALFDFDGTLAQSEDTHRRTFAKILDISMDMDFWETYCVGHAPPEIIARYRKPDALHSVEELVAARAALFEDAIERGELPLTGGTHELLACLRETLWGVTAELSGSSALGAEEAVSYADLNYAKFVRARAALVLEPCPPS